jgi:CheY-like chemotaxis protein
MQGRTVLYAEDDENDAFFMERAFAKMSERFALRVVTNGQAVKEYLLGGGAFADRTTFPRPVLLLLDVKMPLLTGLDVLRWARARPEFDHLPIVIFTSSTQQTDIDFCAAHGASAYLVKPPRADQLAELMPRVLAEASRPAAGKRRLAIPCNHLAPE